MKGRDHFNPDEAEEIRRLLRGVRQAEQGAAQKALRDRLRALGFYITDWAGGPQGFTASEFDDLVERGLVTIWPGAHGIPPDAGTLGVSSPAPACGQTSGRPRPDTEGRPVEERMIDAACESLEGPGIPVATATAGEVPNRPGLYALYASPGAWQQLGLGHPPDARALYVGKAERSLESRDLKQHFAIGKTGWSSPRRSFAALLATTEVLTLVATPRRPSDPEPDKWTHFALEPPGDQALTDWMLANLTIAIWLATAGTDLARVEVAVIRRCKPPLNLLGVRTPWRRQVCDARDVLAEQAKKWARDRGFPV
jgi:hypothetical protein